jgi:squalene-hopene/tetraprenyl-beta-curcumene cyclase
LHEEFDVEKGGWAIQGKVDPGLTGLIVAAFADSPRQYTIDDGPFIEKSLEMIAGMAKKDGSIHDGELANYKTSAAVQALAKAGGGKYREVIDRARAYLTKLQLDESEGYEPDNKFYGGAGYGGDQRPDLSNLSLWLDGMMAAGEPKGSDSFKRALKFLERCQNNSEVNTGRYEAEGKVYVSGDDGGGVYYPGNSKAGYDKLADGSLVPRSYGSMTYALLKGYMAADLDRNDPRVKAAIRWISANFTLEENPGFDTTANPTAGLQGVYYYYYTLAKAMTLYGVPTVKSPDGKEHDWRRALAEKLLSLQREDGSWVNDNGRWWEGLPELVTTYAVLALDMCYDGLATDAKKAKKP